MSALTNGRGQAPVALLYEQTDVPAGMTLAEWRRAYPRQANRRWWPWKRRRH